MVWHLENWINILWVGINHNTSKCKKTQKITDASEFYKQSPNVRQKREFMVHKLQIALSCIVDTDSTYRTENPSKLHSINRGLATGQQRNLISTSHISMCPTPRHIAYTYHTELLLFSASPLLFFHSFQIFHHLMWVCVCVCERFAYSACCPHRTLFTHSSVFFSAVLSLSFQLSPSLLLLLLWLKV